MAREEHDREDLLREATALVERVELSVEGFEEPIVVGFRREGQASIFFGGDPAYHFNSRNELRRAYVTARLFKAEGGRLVALARQRSADEVALVRHALDDEEMAAFLSEVTAKLCKLRAALAARECQIIGQVPAEVDVVERVSAWLDDMAAPPSAAASPHVS